MDDLNDEQKLEKYLRNVKPIELKDDPEVVQATEESIKIAEKLVGAKMADPRDPAQLKKIEETPEYKELDSDDEEEDTRETRASLKQAEKSLKTRFFINAKDKRAYEAMVASGKISAKELAFAEDDDAEIGADPTAAAEKELVKKAKIVAKVEEVKAKEVEAAADKAAVAAGGKPEKKIPKVEVTPEIAALAKAAASSDLPPELAAPASK
jgi:hypothetical protein